MSKSVTATRRESLAVTLLLLLGACAAAEGPAVTREDYASFRTALRGDPALRREQTAACVREGTAKPEAHRQWLAELLRTSVDNAVRTYCDGLTQALAFEEISYEDYVALATGRADWAAASRVAEAVRLFSGPRLAADEFAALRERLAGDAIFRNERTQECMRELGALWTQAERAGFAAALNVDPEDVVHSYCMRLNGAIASGRLSYEEWQGLMNMDRDPDARERALQVLREEPEAVT